MTAVVVRGGTRTKRKSPIIELAKGTRLVRIYAQPPGAPPRDIAFNPASAGRVSPVLDRQGNPDPAMYFAVDSSQGAVMELMYHTVIKRYPAGGVVPESIFENLQVVELVLQTSVKMVSIQVLQELGDIPADFSSGTADYAQTRMIAQKQYALRKSAAGFTWHSARGSSVVGAWYETRVPRGTFKLGSAPALLMRSSLSDFVDSFLAGHGIAVDHGFF